MATSRKRPGKAKKAPSEEQYRLLFESNPHPMWVYDLKSLSFVAVNEAAVHHYGYSRDEFLGMTIKEIRPEEDVPALLENVSRVTEGLDIAGVWRHRKKDGSVILVEITSHTLTFEGRRSEIVMANDITERMRAENALKRSEEKYKDLFENANDAICIVDSLRNFKDVNLKTTELTGYSREDLLKMNVYDIIPIEQIPLSNIEFDKLREKGSYEKFTGKIRTKSGNFIDVEVSSSAIIEDGKIIGSRDIIRDITERKQSEEKLKLFRNLIDRSSDAIFINDPETGIILDVNEKACKNLGYSRDELLKMRVFDFEAVLPDHFSWKEHVKDVREKGHMILEGLHKRKDGSAFPVEINVSHTIFGKNNFMLAVVRDITERKRIEDELKIKAQLLDKATDSIFMFDLDGNFVYMNDATYKSRGYSKDELMKLNLHNIAVPEYSKLINVRSKKVIENGDAVFESAHFRKDGSIIPVEVHARVIDSGGRKLILGVTRDITERKKTEKMLHDNARAEFYGFIVSALPVFATNIPSSVRTALVSNFAERFERNMRPRFEDEIKRLDASGNIEMTLNVLIYWLLGLFSNLGIEVKTTSQGTDRGLEFSNCPWTGEASGNPIYCFICRTIVIRSFSWTVIKGSAEQISSIANGSKSCRFEIQKQ